MTAPDWGMFVDAADWEPEPPREPEPEVDPTYAWMLAAQRILHHKVERMDRARALARRAIEALVAAKEEVDAAVGLVEEACREAAAKGDGRDAA